MKRISYILLTLLIMVAIAIGGSFLGLWHYTYFAPKTEKARREVFEHTQSYVEGKRMALTKHYNEWRKSDPADREAIRTLVLQEFANFDTEKFTPQQKQWYRDITQ